MRAFRSIYPVDEAIAAVASRQGGVVGRGQLAGLGVERGAIRHRLEIGRLRSYFHGVYAVGHEALQARGRLVAGLLVAGPGAALTHRTASGLLKLTPSLPPFVEITTTTTRPRSRPGLVFHHAATIDATLRHALPVTTPIRTLLDLAVTLPRADLERACSEALVLGLVAPTELTQQHGHGSAVLAQLAHAGIAPTRSELERRLLKAVVKAGLPRPEVNERVGRHRVDFLWREQLLIVETDGRRFHDHPIAIERDHRRDAELQLRGYTVLRFTWWQVVHETAAAIAQLARFLSRPALRRAS
jgi:very-short-patch-repair endonuclease